MLKVRCSVRQALRLVLALFALGLVAGCATRPLTRVSLAEVAPAQAGRAEHNLEVFYRVWDLVNRKHYDPKYQGVNWEEAAVRYGPPAAAATDEPELYRVLNSMVGQLHDSHTHVLSPREREMRRTQQTARTGFSMLQLEGRWVVNEVLPKSPAEEAGVKVGWIVLSRDGQPLGDRLEFRAEVGDAWQWEFLDDKDQRVTLAPQARRLSIAPRQVAQSLEGGIVYLRFDGFDATDRRWLSRQLKANRDAPGVVIDLRRNPGGDTFSLGTAVGEFFDRRVDCGTFISRGGEKSAKKSWQFGSANYRGKVAILVGGATGSAAEIFSAVLQDHGRATVIGRRTAGAVLASWFYRLPDGGELQLSLYDYLAPKGRRIEAHGVEPDVTVPQLLQDVRTGRDRDLEEALRVLRGA